MLEEILQEVAADTGVPMATVNVVILDFIKVMLKHSIFFVWQRVMKDGRSSAVCFIANITDIRGERDRLSHADILTLTGNVRETIQLTHLQNTLQINAQQKQIEDLE